MGSYRKLAISPAIGFARGPAVSSIWLTRYRKSPSKTRCPVIIDKSRVESNVTEGVANGDEYILITAYERQKHIRIRDVRLGLNPIELLPEKADKVRPFGFVQSKTSIKVYERTDLPWR